MSLCGVLLFAYLAAAPVPAPPAGEAGKRAAAVEKTFQQKLPKANSVKVTIEPSKDDPVDTATLVVEYGKGAVPGYDAVKFKAVKEVKKDAPPLTMMAAQTTNGQDGDVALVRFDGGGKWVITKLFELEWHFLSF